MFMQHLTASRDGSMTKVQITPNFPPANGGALLITRSSLYREKVTACFADWNPRAVVTSDTSPAYRTTYHRILQSRFPPFELTIDLCWVLGSTHASTAANSVSFCSYHQQRFVFSRRQRGAITGRSF